MSQKNMNTNPGYANEERVARALSIIQALKRPWIPEPIKDIVHALPNSEADQNGVDFWIFFRSGRRIPLQVKSSRRGQLKFEKRCRKLGINIPVVIVNANESIRFVIRRLIHRIKQALEEARECINHFVNEIRFTRPRTKKNKKGRERCNRQFCFRMCH